MMMYVLVDPSVRLEPLRMVIVEALACRKPSGTGSSARPETVDPSCHGSSATVLWRSSTEAAQLPALLRPLVTQ
jgi:hypothetical protein